MASLDRDAILQALFARLQDHLAGDVKTFTRRLETYLNTPNLPALVMLSGRHTSSHDSGRPPIWTLAVEVMIYLETLEADASPETRLNVLVQKLEDALALSATEPRQGRGGDDRNTSLGSLCSSCQVTSVEIGQGTEGGEGLATVAISLVAPAP